MFVSSFFAVCQFVGLSLFFLFSLRLFVCPILWLLVSCSCFVLEKNMIKNERKVNAMGRDRRKEDLQRKISLNGNSSTKRAIPILTQWELAN